MKTGRWKTILAVVCSSALALSVGIVAVGVSLDHLRRWQAERLLAALDQITVGVTDRATAMRILSPFQKHRTDDPDEGFRRWIFEYYNAYLYRMHIAPYPDTVVIVSLDFDRDVVEQKYASVFSSPGIYASISESKRGFGYLDGKVTCETPTHTAYPSWYSRTELDRIIIHDDDSYDRKEREKDWAISLSCMTRIGGCSDARSIMPLALPLSATSDTSQRELKFADGCK